MYERHETGRVGEDIASNFLEKLGHRIVVRNYSCNIGEIDIISKDKNELVFVEVKTRSQLRFGNPVDAVNNIKQNHIYRVAEYFVMMNHLEKTNIRFDIIEIYFYEEHKYKINYLKNAITERPKNGRYKNFKERG